MDISVLVLVAVICVAVAVLIGYLLATVLGGKSSLPPPPQARQEGLDHLISFWTDRQLRQIIPQIDGKVIVAPNLLKENERRQLLLLYQALRKWLNLEATVVQDAAEPPAQTATLSPSMSGVQVEEQLSSIPASPKKGVADWLAQSLQPKSAIAEPPKSIAMQVDEILQKKLVERGWNKRGIRLMELPNKGMVVLIGLNQYATVDEVPNPEIQALIRASVREWETKMLGG